MIIKFNEYKSEKGEFNLFDIWKEVYGDTDKYNRIVYQNLKDNRIDFYCDGILKQNQKEKDNKEYLSSCMVNKHSNYQITHTKIKFGISGNGYQVPKVYVRFKDDNRFHKVSLSKPVSFEPKTDELLDVMKKIAIKKVTNQFDL